MEKMTDHCSLYAVQIVLRYGIILYLQIIHVFLYAIMRLSQLFEKKNKIDNMENCAELPNDWVVSVFFLSKMPYFDATTEVKGQFILAKKCNDILLFYSYLLFLYPFSLFIAIHRNHVVVKINMRVCWFVLLIPFTIPFFGFVVKITTD